MNVEMEDGFSSQSESVHVYQAKAVSQSRISTTDLQCSLHVSHCRVDLVLLVQVKHEEVVRRIATERIVEAVEANLHVATERDDGPRLQVGARFGSHVRGVRVDEEVRVRERLRGEADLLVAVVRDWTACGIRAPHEHAR